MICIRTEKKHAHIARYPLPGFYENKSSALSIFNSKKKGNITKKNEQFSK